MNIANTITSSRWPRRALLLFEGSSDGGDLRFSMQAGLEAYGCQVICRRAVTSLPDDVELIMGYGPFNLYSGNLLPTAIELAHMPATERPRFVWWLTEGVPQPQLPLAAIKLAATMRVLVDQVLMRRLRSFLPARQLLFKGHRLRILGQLLWAQAHHVLDLLVVTSKQRADYLDRLGVPSLVTPLGYHPVYGVNLGLERTIDVAFLGDLRSPRRRRLLPPLFDELIERGMRVEIRDNLYGPERSDFLNRSKIMLNILRSPQDFTGHRYLLGAANKALVVSELVEDYAPFIPDKHLIVAASHELPEKIAFYVTHEEQRHVITDAAYTFVTQELTIEKQIGQILARLQCQDDHGAETQSNVIKNHHGNSERSTFRQNA
jgi:hypothetical protein